MEGTCQRASLELCGPGAAGGPPILLDCMFSHYNFMFPYGTSCSAGGADCTLCPPGEAHRTPTSTFPAWPAGNWEPFTAVDLGCLEDRVPVDGLGHGVAGFVFLWG